MKRTKSIFSYLLLGLFLGSLLICSGCWDRRELDQINIVGGVAVDQPHDPNRVLITAQVIDPELLGSSSKPGNPFPVWNIATTGYTMFDAIRNCTHESSNQLFWADSALIIFGEGAARKGIRADLDFFLRDPETRNSAYVLVAGGNASDCLMVQTHIDSIPAYYISDLVERHSSTSQSMQVNLLEFGQRVVSKTTAPVAPIIRIQQEGKEKNLHLLGTAVFNKQVQYIGNLDAMATRGLLWTLSKVESGILVVQSPVSKEKLSLEIVEAKGKIIPTLKDGKILITIKISAKCNVGETRDAEALNSEALWKSLERREATAIRNEVLAALQKSRSLNADIFGFGDKIGQKYPTQWKEIEPHWQERFPEVEVGIQVNAQINRMGRITKPIIAK